MHWLLIQALHPEDDPVLDIDDVPEALRDVNGELTRADSDVIMEVCAMNFVECSISCSRSILS